MLKLAEEGVIYARVSSARQVKEGHGISSQIRACQSFAKENGIKIIKIFKDPGKSGASLDRPSLNELISFLKKRDQLTYVIVYSLERLTRDKKDYYPLKEIVGVNKGIAIDIKGIISNDDDPFAGFLEHSMIGHADLWRRINRINVIENQTQRLKQGYWVFPAPLGYLFKDRSLAIEPNNAKLIKKILEDFADGRYSTYMEISQCKEANLLVNPRSGKGYKLKDDTIKKLLTNKLYMGKVEYKPWHLEEVDGVHEPIISERIFQKIQNRLKVKGRKKHSNISPEEFPLKGDLVCGNCKSRLVYSKAKGRNKKYPYYRCNTSREICDINPKNIRTEAVHEQFLELLNHASIKPQVLKLADKVLEDIYVEKRDNLVAYKRQKILGSKNLPKEEMY